MRVFLGLVVGITCLFLSFMSCSTLALVTRDGRVTGTEWIWLPLGVAFLALAAYAFSRVKKPTTAPPDPTDDEVE